MISVDNILFVGNNFILLEVFVFLYVLFISLLEMFYSLYIKKDNVSNYRGFFSNLIIGQTGEIIRMFFWINIWFFVFMSIWSFIPSRFHLPIDNLWVWVVGFLLYDLIFYVSHRIYHSCNFFWTFHSVHHSEEGLNYSTGYRLSWFDFIHDWLLFIPMILLGYHPMMVLFYRGLFFFYQVFMHAQYIYKKNTWIDYIFVTAATHRVHHGKNSEYLDTNFGGILNIWDVIFKTFRKLTVQPVYGILDPVSSRNPFVINFLPFYRFYKRFPRNSSFWNMVKYVFGHP
jgi:sterol desaturase/sphingolipid hydroxylase (fatty acid hydroxylase superfamily)